MARACRLSAVCQAVVTDFACKDFHEWTEWTEWTDWTDWTGFVLEVGVYGELTAPKWRGNFCAEGLFAVFVPGMWAAEWDNTRS